MGRRDARAAVVHVAVRPADPDRGAVADADRGVLEAAVRIARELSQWGIRHWTEPVRQMRRDLGLTPGPAGIFGPREKAKAIVAMFSPLVGRPQPDWPPNARVTGFAFYDCHEPMPAALQAFLDAGDPPIVFTLGSAAVFDPGEFYRDSAAAAAPSAGEPVLLVGPDQPRCLPRTRTLRSLRTPRSLNCFRGPRRSCTRPASAPRRRRCVQAGPC